MKKSLAFLTLLLVCRVQSVRGDTPLHIGYVPGPLTIGACWYDATIGPGTSGSFAISGITGTGQVSSYVLVTLNPPPPAGPPVFRNLFLYTLNLSGMSSSTGHCVRISIPFGTPATCDFDTDSVPDQVLVLSGGGGTPIASATQSGNVVQIVFQGGGSSCLLPGQQSVTFGMLSDRPVRTNVVTITDAQGTPTVTNTVNVTARAVVPNIPPLVSVRIRPILQGWLQGHNGLPLNGTFELRMLLHDDETNGVPASETLIETVSIKNGLFNAPLNFDPSTFHQKPRWLGLAVRTNKNDPFVPLTTRLPVAPTPAALYANEAGFVSALAPGQAVTSLNGLTDGVTVQAGQGLVLAQQGNTLILSAAQPSDRNLKTDLNAASPSEILNGVLSLRLQTWRYTNELLTVRHLGPMAQDFHAAFGLGDNDKQIAIVDADGVALTAIQGLNQKLLDELKRRDAESAELKALVDELREQMQSLKKDKRAHD